MWPAVAINCLRTPCWSTVRQDSRKKYYCQRVLRFKSLQLCWSAIPIHKESGLVVGKATSTRSGLDRTGREAGFSRRCSSSQFPPYSAAATQVLWRPSKTRIALRSFLLFHDLACACRNGALTPLDVLQPRSLVLPCARVRLNLCHHRRSMKC